MASDPSGSFRTHANYLRAIASEAGLETGRPEATALARLLNTAQPALSVGSATCQSVSAA